MDFNDNQPIWLQIYNLICRRIADGTYPSGERIPSLRDLAVELQVNPNTCVRAYNRLEAEGMIFNRRGIGYFVSDHAEEQGQKLLREEFTEKEIPLFFERMTQAGVTLDELCALYEKYLNQKSHENK